MDPTIIGAIVGGAFAIVAAVIGLYPRLRRRSSRDEPSIISRPAKNRSDVQFPEPHDPEHLTRSEVHRLVEFYGLFRRWRTNPHLAFQDGDVSYWYEQEFSLTDLCREFESRRAILEQAEESHRTIATQGDLSALAQGVQAHRQG